MRINNNIMSLNAHRQLGANQAAGSKSMEKLSSGLRINRAGDDAAGLAISEKMRGQIRGLKQASRNAQDGISLIQTAEGSLNETHAILQRMRELANQAANDTNIGSDRDEIQNELNQLVDELDRIGNQTEFNTQKLLNGGDDGNGFNVTLQIGANSGQVFDIDISDMRAEALGLSGAGTTGYVAKDFGAGETVAAAAGGTNVSGNATVTGKFTGTLETAGDTTVSLKYSHDGVDAKWQVSTDGSTWSDATESSGKVTVSGLTIDVGAATLGVADGDTGQWDITVSESGTVGGALDVSSNVAANTALDSIDAAITSVSQQRSKLGAFQNRLEHTISNLGTSAENLQAAESRIRDLDMAEEMMNFTKSNILNQAATAMLAQANMAPQSVLQLLG